MPLLTYLLSLTGKEQLSIEIAARLLTQRKTKEYLIEVLTEICNDWKIKRERVRGVTTDGGANIKAAVKSLFGEDKHVTCLAHLLNGIGQKVIGNHAAPPSEVELTAAEASRGPADDGEDDDGDFDVDAEEREARGHPRKELIVKTKKIVRFFKQSEVATAKLCELQMVDGKQESKCLKHVQEVRTRFNSCYDMCVRYVSACGRGLREFTALAKHFTPLCLFQVSRAGAVHRACHTRAPAKQGLSSEAPGSP